MKILHTVEYYSPSVGGAQEVVKQISDQLTMRGHKVTVATTKLANRANLTINGAHVEEFNISGNAVRGYRGEITHYRQFLLDSRFDVMMNYAAQQWATDLVFSILDRIPYRKVLAPCGFSGVFDPKYDQYFEELSEVMRRYHKLIFHSYTYRDIEFAMRHGLSHYAVIPNGALAEEFGHVDRSFRPRYGIPGDVPLLLTVGSHTGLKGHGLVIEAFRQARIGSSVLVIVGNVPGRLGCWPGCWGRARLIQVASLGRKQVLLLNPPRSDVVAAFHTADLFVFGSNVECSPLVLFEAMASKTPFLTIACGNAEEVVKWGQGGIVVPTIRNRDGTVTANPKSMAHIIEELIMNPEERSRLGEAGYKAWEGEFTWETIATRYEEIYRDILNQTG